MATTGSEQPEIPEAVGALLIKTGDAWRAQDFGTAKQHANEALDEARKQNSTYGELGALHFLANIAFNECEDMLSRRLHEQIETKSQEMGFLAGVASSAANLALLDLVDGNEGEARLKYERASRLYEEAGQPEMSEGMKAILKRERIFDVLQDVPRKQSK